MTTLQRGARRVKSALRTNGSSLRDGTRAIPLTPPSDPDLWPDSTDLNRWELGPEPTPDPEPYEPTPADLADYERWLDSLGRSGGCSPTDLSPDEIAMYAGTMPAIEFFNEHLDPTHDIEQDEARVRAELGLSL